MTSKRKISHLQLEKAFFVPSFAELRGRTLNAQFYPSIQMLAIDTGVECTLDSLKGNKLTFHVPWSKIEIAVYEVANVELPTRGASGATEA